MTQVKGCGVQVNVKGGTTLDTANANKILGYFIEEAKEHLETLEKGILELESVVKDSERVNEMFRAAHSIKGGSAMLGYTSIQKTAHRLEDAFKILRENEVPADQKLESLLLKGYDLLHELIERLQSPGGLNEQEGSVLAAQAEPMFSELQNHLNQILGGTVATTSDELIAPPVAAASAGNLSSQIKNYLRQMLQVFKQEDNPESRQKLQNLCKELGKVAPNESAWQHLIKLTQGAISNPKYNYRTLAPVVIKELKHGCDLIELGQAHRIAASSDFQQLATSRLPQVLIPADPKSAANALLQVFNKQQLSQLVQMLQAAS